MADKKLNTGPAENISPEAAEPIATPEQAAASEPQQEQTGPVIPESGDVVVSFDKINELMAEKRQNARAEVEKSEPPETPEAAAPGETPQPANTEEPKKPRRGRPPKAEKAATENQKAEKSAGARKGRPPKADKAAPDKPKPSKRDKVSRSDGKAPDAKEPIKPAQDTALKETAAVEQTAPEPTTPPRPVEEGKLVYLKLSEVHPFHTFRPHPFKVRDDAKMQEIVASIRVNGVMVPGLARPEKDGNGYEIVAGHRRTHGSELAGLEEMPFIVREMTDHEAVQAMKDSNKQRDGMLPSELAALLELEVEDIKHQGGRLKDVAEGDVGKRSVEIVGEAHEMNYKKVMPRRYGADGTRLWDGKTPEEFTEADAYRFMVETEAVLQRKELMDDPAQPAPASGKEEFYLSKKDDVLLTPEQIAAEERRWLFDAPIAELAEVKGVSIDEAVKMRTDAVLQEAVVPITVSVRPIEPQGKLIGFASVNFGGVVIDDFKVVDGKNGIFLGAPSKPDPASRTGYRATVRIPDRATQERINAAGVEAYHAAVEQLVARAQAVRPAPIKEQMAEAAKQAGKENTARPAPAKAKEARNDR